MILCLLLTICAAKCSTSATNCNGLDFLCGGDDDCIFQNSLLEGCKPCRTGEDCGQVHKLERKRRSTEVTKESASPETYLYLKLNPSQKDISAETLALFAHNITSHFGWAENTINNCLYVEDHLTCSVSDINPVLVSTELALDKTIDTLTPIIVDSVGTSIKNATVLATEDKLLIAPAITTKPMTFADVMIWVFGAILLTLLVSLFLVYIVQRKKIDHQPLKETGPVGPETSEFYYESLVRSRIAEQNNHRPPQLTQRQMTDVNSIGGGVNSPKRWQEEKASPILDVSNGHLILNYMEEYHQNQDKLEKEWEILCAYEPENNRCELGKRPENLSKNRFPSVLPYDYNRVKLAHLHASDYINASYITTDHPKHPTYIATQGPLQHCAGDFWQMVWEQGVSEVIMLATADNEDCYQYWPTEGNELYYHYQLHLVSEHYNQTPDPDYVVRSFYLKNLQTYETRTVTQFHYIGWTLDQSAPRSTQSLLDFRRKVHKSYRGPAAPVVVHCNDGIGRTGTYVLLDMTLSRLCKGLKEIDMAATIEHLRDQRAGMVVTKEQYAFALAAFVEEVYSILEEMPTNGVPSSPPE